MKMIPIGKTTLPLGEVEISIDIEKHTFIVGKSGVGKSTLLLNIATHAIRENWGLAMVDPHGDLVDDQLERIPIDRTKDVILFDPRGPNPIGINPMEGKDRDLSVDGLVSLIMRLWPAAWGPRTEQLIVSACIAILEAEPHPTVLYVHLFFARFENRAKVFAKCQDGIIKDFEDMYDHRWDKRQREEATAAVANKISKFVLNRLVRAVFGQPKSLPFRYVMDSGKILLAKLPKGALGVSVAKLFGRTVVDKVFSAALEREDVPSEERRPFLLIIDEVADFADGEALERIFSEARKYRLTVVIGAQTITQLEDPNAVIGNCSNLLCFRVAGKDAKFLEDELLNFPARAFMEQPNRHCIGQTVTPDDGDTPGHPYGPFKIRLYPPLKPRKDLDNSRADVESWSRENWGVKREIVEERIQKFLAPPKREVQNARRGERNANRNRKGTKGTRRSRKADTGGYSGDPGGEACGNRRVRRPVGESGLHHPEEAGTEAQGPERAG